MAQHGWIPAASQHPPKEGPEPSGTALPPETVDLERLARDQIAKLIIAKFKGHGMARLVEAILRAQGYVTWLSPEGPDKGVDILAAPGPLGFAGPRICVQVKSGDGPTDHPTLSQLIGTMQNVQADQGLLVSWGGFKSSIEKETSRHFFRVRLWDQDVLTEQVLAHYAKLDPEVRA
jgi:restriction system protein